MLRRATRAAGGFIPAGDRFITNSYASGLYSAVSGQITQEQKQDRPTKPPNYKHGQKVSGGYMWKCCDCKVFHDIKPEKPVDGWKCYMCRHRDNIVGDWKRR